MVKKLEVEPIDFNTGFTGPDATVNVLETTNENLFHFQERDDQSDDDGLFFGKMDFSNNDR